MSLLDPIGTLLSLTATYYFTKARLCAWFIAIPAILINFILYWQKGIYGHAMLESVYLLSTLYGIMKWHEKKQKASRPISRLSSKAFYKILAFSFILIGLFAFVLKHFFHSDIYLWDAATWVLALLAQWMLCQKWIQCWMVWFIVDVMVGVINFYKGIPFHSLHHFIYLGMAVLGHLRWSRILNPAHTGEYTSKMVTG